MKGTFMTILKILGSANAISDEKHENTHMALVGKNHTLLIDCVGNPIVRLQKAAIDPDHITDVILTHFHPDHVSGLPLLLMNMWLLGRQRPLKVYGLEYTLERMEKLMDYYDWSSWPNFFPVSFETIHNHEMSPVLENDEWRVYASPVRHLIPTIGLRVEFPKSNKSFAYSCDTEPCSQVSRLAEDVDILIHECSGNPSPGHSSASQAGEIAQNANSKSLYLIHYPTKIADSLPTQAAKTFGGPVALAQDLMELEF
jgi:ribonuclease Z